MARDTTCPHCGRPGWGVEDDATVSDPKNRWPPWAPSAIAANACLGIIATVVVLFSH